MRTFRYCLFALVGLALASTSWACELRGMVIDFPHTLCDALTQRCAQVPTSLKFLGTSALLSGFEGSANRADGFVLKIGSFDRLLEPGDLPATVRNGEYAGRGTWLGTLLLQNGEIHVKIKRERFLGDVASPDYARSEYTAVLRVGSCSSCRLLAATRRSTIKPYSDWEKVVENASATTGSCTVSLPSN